MNESEKEDRLLDVPEPVELESGIETEPFEDAVTNEIVLLDIIRLDTADIEELEP